MLTTPFCPDKSFWNGGSIFFFSFRVIADAGINLHDPKSPPPPESCTICLADYGTDEPEDAVCDGLCGHRFHTRCLLELLVKAPKRSTLKCPNCRKSSILLFPGFPAIFPDMIYDRDEAVAHVFRRTAAFMPLPWKFQAVIVQQRDRVFAYLVAHCELELRACVYKLVGDSEETRSWFNGFFENKTGFKEPPCYDYRNPQHILHYEELQIAIKPLPRRWSRDVGAVVCPDYCGTHAICPGETDHERLFKEGEFVANGGYDPCPFLLARAVVGAPLKKEGYAYFRPKRKISYFVENAIDIYKVLRKPGYQPAPWYEWLPTLKTIRLEPAVSEEDSAAITLAAFTVVGDGVVDSLSEMVRDGLVFNIGGLGSVWGHRTANNHALPPDPRHYANRINGLLREGSRVVPEREPMIARGEMLRVWNPTVRTAHPRMTNPSCRRHWNAVPNEYMCRCVLVTCRLHKDLCRCHYPATIYCRCDSGDCVLHAVPVDICTCIQLCVEDRAYYVR